MSNTGFTTPAGNWTIAPNGSISFTYSSLQRAAPSFTKVVTLSSASYVESLLNANEITDQGFYLITIEGNFSSTPWNLRTSIVLPLGFIKQTPYYAPAGYPRTGLHAIHAGNGNVYRFTYAFTGNNNERNGLQIRANYTFATGTITARFYKITNG